MQYFPPEIKERIIDGLANHDPVLTIALAMSCREFYDIIAVRYRGRIRRGNDRINGIAAALFTRGCHKLAIYYVTYPNTGSEGLGTIYPKIISHGSPQLLDVFIRGIIPKYIKNWPDFIGPTFISLPNFKVIKRRCDELGYNITNTSLINLIKKGCIKVAMWALDQIMKREYEINLAHVLLERGHSKLIRKLMSVNADLFLGDGAITAAMKGNCEREIFDLLYGLGAQCGCHTIDNAITRKIRPETLTTVLEYSNEIHHHTERAILNTLNPDLMYVVLSQRPITTEMLSCSSNAIKKITYTTPLIVLLCDRIIDNNEILHYIISKFNIEYLKIVLHFLSINKPLDFNQIKRNTTYLEKLISQQAENNITDKEKSKIWLLYTYRFAVPSTIINLMHRYDSIILAQIVCERREIPPFRLLVVSKVGSKIRAYYGDICSKLSPITAMTSSVNMMA